MKKYILIIFSLLFLIPGKSNATHIAGAYLNYDYISGNQYLLKLMLFRDCSGNSAPTTVDICYSSTSCNFSAIATLIITTNVTAIPPCPYLPPFTTTCQGGVAFGLEMYTYAGVLTLPLVCSDWELSYTAPKTGGVSPGQLYPNFMVSTKIDNQNFANNNSPDFNHTPIFQYCIGQLGYDDLSATDSDGDSLRYELIPSVTDSFICPVQQMPPSAGSLIFQPLSSTPFYMDSVGGWLNFTPTTIQLGQLTVRVSEFRLGQLINETLISHTAYSIGSCVVSNIENQPESNISIFPNPVIDQLNILIPETGTIRIVSATGQKVFSESQTVTANENFQLNVSQLPPGIYYLLLNGKNVFNGKMFVKN